MNAEGIIQKHYDVLFDMLVSDYDLEDLYVGPVTRDGLTIRISWKERNNILGDEEA